MKIEIWVGSYRPKKNSAATLYGALAEWLAIRGHGVRVVTLNLEGQVSVLPSYDQSDTSITVSRFKRSKFLENMPAGGALSQIQLFFSLMLTSNSQFKPDVILVYSPPLFVSFAAVLSGLVWRVPVVLHVQDLHPSVLAQSKMVTSRAILSLLGAVEKFIYRYSRAQIVYSKGNRDYLAERGADPRAIETIPNWITTNAHVTNDNPSSELCELLSETESVTALYAGAFGKPQGLDVLLMSAPVLYDQLKNKVKLVLVGDGVETAKLENMARGMSNVLIQSRVSEEEYAKILGFSDIGIVSLSVDVPAETVPGKLSNLMAAGIPILFIGNVDGDAAKLIRSAKCGVIAAAGDVVSIVNCICEMVGNTDMLKSMGRNGKHYAQKNFSLDACGSQIESCLLGAINPHCQDS